MKKILITGPESSGKTALTKALAKHFNCPWVAEYAREYLTQLGRPYREEDLSIILSGQLAKEQETANDTDSFLFCDTGPEVIYIWSQVKYNRIAPLIIQATQRQYYDFRIICYPDLKWENDLLRETPDADQRQRLFDINCLLHSTNNWPYIVAQGQGDARIKPSLKCLKEQFFP